MFFSEALGVPDVARRRFLAEFRDRYSDTIDGGSALGHTRFHTINAGLVGLALAFHHIGLATADAALVRVGKQIVAETRLAIAELEIPEGIDPEFVRTSPFHSVAGLAYAEAIMAVSNGDSAASPVREFASIAALPTLSMDATLGHASTLLAASSLIENVDVAMSAVARAACDPVFDAVCAFVRDRDTSTAGINSVNLAHGWTGILHALLRYSNALGTHVERLGWFNSRVDQIASSALHDGAGSWFPYSLDGDGPDWARSSWCNGTGGTTQFFALLFEANGNQEHLALAKRLAFHCGQSTDKRVYNICCGLAGQVYALLSVARQCDEPMWLKRAHEIAELAAIQALSQSTDAADVHGLFKGKAGLALLFAELECQGMSRMPLVESVRYRRSGESDDLHVAFENAATGPATNRQHRQLVHGGPES